jgi:L-malate glycosyltransferase
MKICFLAAGDSVHSIRWIRYFALKGHEVYWISLAGIIEEVPKGVVFYQLQLCKNILSFIKIYKKVKKLIHDIRPDILHSHYAGIYGLLGAISGFRPLVLTAWGSDINFAGSSLPKGLLIRLVLKKAKLITCDAQHMKEKVKNFGIREDKIRIVNFGVEINKFRPLEKSNEIRKSFGIGDSPVVISLRNFEQVYNIETLLKAVPCILRNCPETFFLIAGTGSQEAYLKNLTASLGISKNVIFTGRVNHDLLPELLSAADVYVSTSLSDAGIAASTAEAMACEMPVVVTDSGENEKWIKDGENGFIVPVKNSEILAEKIIYLLKNPLLAKKMAAKAREKIVQYNNYYNEMFKMEKIYESLI